MRYSIIPAALIPILLFLISLPLSGGAEAITIEDVFRKGLFDARGLDARPHPDGEHFTVLEDGHVIALYRFKTGERIGPLLDTREIGLGPISDYAFCEDGERALLTTGSEPRFPRGSTAQTYVWDRGADTIKPLSRNGRQRVAEMSPDGSKAAFVRDQNLYVRILGGEEEREITNDGQADRILNGAADYVYYEFDMEQAFAWSPDGKKLAYYRFDESGVPLVTIPFYMVEGSHPEYRSYRFPKPGEPNAVVQIYIYDCESDAARRVDLGEETDIYIPRIQWTPDSKSLCLTRLNRLQNRIELLLADPRTGKTRAFFTESDAKWIDIHDNLIFLPGGRGFLWTTERDGFNHIYYYSMLGKLIRQVTKGTGEIRALHGYDPKRGLIVYTAVEGSPLRTAVYAASLDGKKTRRLTERPGGHRAVFSADTRGFIDTFSTAGQPPEISVRAEDGKMVRILEDNMALKVLARDHGFAAKEFFTFVTSDGVDLNGWIIKPADFDATKSYPVLMYEYGGPGSQTVTDAWDPSTAWWQMLAQRGMIVASVDGRGSGGRGRDFKKITYLSLGKWETHDQIEAAEYLAGLPYVDGGRIGIFGGSYGGYMAALCLLKGADTFRCGVVSKPVTHWKYYDTIYTERYMRTPLLNPEGYRESAPLTYVDRLKGSLLLTHGTADDNVHVQHSLVFAQALVEAGKSFDMFLYTDRNHGYNHARDGETRFHLHRKITEFFLKNL